MLHNINITVSVIALAFTLPAHSRELQKPQKEVQAEYSRLWTTPSQGLDKASLDRLRQHHILFAPGILADVFLDIHYSYFDDQMRELTRLGISNERVKVESEGSIQGNALILANAIERSKLPVLIISHSKGGLDTLECLIQRPDLIGKVKGWTTIQSSMHGTPVADLMRDHPSLRRFWSYTLGKWGGSIRMMDNLSEKDRAVYMRDNHDAIVNVTSQVPLVFIATWKPKTNAPIDTTLQPFRDWLLSKGIASDGTVPLSSQKLPGADIAFHEGLDHMVTVMPASVPDFDRKKFSRVLLKMLFNRLDKNL